MRLAKLGADVVGIDLSENSLKIAKEKNSNIAFYNKNMLEPYSELGKFDGIVCIAGIVHLQNEELQVAFKNMYNALSDNGYLLLVFKEETKVQKTTIFNNETYERNFICYTKDEIEKYIYPYFRFIVDITKSSDNWKCYIYKKY